MLDNPHVLKTGLLHHPFSGIWDRSYFLSWAGKIRPVSGVSLSVC